MKSIFSTLFILALIAAPLSAQVDYETTMQQSFDFMEQGQIQAAQGIFERIAMAETDKWVPLYHAANILVTQSFEATEQAERETLLSKAKELVAEAHDRSPNNAELLTLEGLLYTSYIVFDPATYGMIYSSKVSALHQRALSHDPENPRAMINAVEFEMGSAQFFGRDTAPLCERAQVAVAAFETYESDVAFAPTHGLEKAERIVASCGEDD
ncbi:MAG: hypothetical protein AAFY36_03330 [Bacteroidota bacterium]